MGGGVGGVPDRIGEDGLHPGHEDLEPLDHRDHLDERELLLAGVVVARSALILFRIRGTLLCARNKLQYILARELNWLNRSPPPRKRPSHGQIDLISASARPRPRPPPSHFFGPALRAPSPLLV